MKIEQINTPQQPTLTGAQATPQLSARERAIQALVKGTEAQQHPVQNPSQVSPEEMTVVQRSSSKPEIGQSDTTKSAQTPTTPNAETKVSEEPLSSQYAILARKEKQIRQREQQIRQREATIKAQEDARKAAEAPKAPTFDPSKYVDRERLTQDPFSVLGELGLSYDQLTELALNAPKPEQIQMLNEMKALKAEIAALKGETENTKKSFQEREEQQNAQALQQIRLDAVDLVKTDPQFEAIRATRGSVSQIVKLIETTFNEDGRLMTVEEAATRVENYLVDEALRVAKIKKVQQKMQPKSAPAEQKATGQSQQQQLKTLTNSVASTRQLSAKERAVLAFEGKLNKS